MVYEKVGVRVNRICVRENRVVYHNIISPVYTLSLTPAYTLSLLHIITVLHTLSLTFTQYYYPLSYTHCQATPHIISPLHTLSPYIFQVPMKSDLFNMSVESSFTYTSVYNL